MVNGITKDSRYQFTLIVLLQVWLGRGGWYEFNHNTPDITFLASTGILCAWILYRKDIAKMKAQGAKFKTMDEVSQYFSGHEVECLECGKYYKHLGTHVVRTHNMSCDDYREKYGIPWYRGLASKEYSEKQSVISKNNFKDGKLPILCNKDNLEKGRLKCMANPRKLCMAVEELHGKNYLNLPTTRKRPEYYI